MLESKFQADLIVELEEMFPGSFVMKTDANQIQGFPDILILYGKQWATLECKRCAKSPFRPNQEYYIEILDDLSFSMVIYPENKREVLRELQQTFRTRR